MDCRESGMMLSIHIVIGKRLSLNYCILGLLYDGVFMQRYMFH